jgi:hypothetical protein
VFKCKIHLRYWRKMTVEPCADDAQLTVRHKNQTAVCACGKSVASCVETTRRSRSSSLQHVSEEFVS